MKTAKKMFAAFIMATLLLALLGTSAFAAENGAAWLATTQTGDGNTQVDVMADTPVTDAYVELTYDETLTCLNVEVNSEYVAYYSVNTDTAGLVKIAWVSAGNYDAASGVILVTVNFEGVSETLPVMSGELQDAQGNQLSICILRDTAALEAAIASAEALVRELYTAETLVDVDVALNAARQVLADETADQNRVDAAAEALNDALNKLEKIPVDKTALRKAVLAARGLDGAHYTEDSFNALLTVLADGEALLEDENVTADAVNSAAEALWNAIDALQLKPSGQEQTLDYDALNKAILIAESLNRYDYTEDSFAVLETALADARAVLADANATQDQVDAAAAALNTAIRELELGTNVPNTGSDGMSRPLALILVLSAMGLIAAAIMMINKKGRCVK